MFTKLRFSPHRTCRHHAALFFNTQAFLLTTFDLGFDQILSAILLTTFDLRFDQILSRNCKMYWLLQICNSFELHFDQILRPAISSLMVLKWEEGEVEFNWRYPNCKMNGSNWTLYLSKFENVFVKKVQILCRVPKWELGRGGGVGLKAGMQPLH